ncbi:MAG: hypothetical protein LBD18_01725 [Treponema sp.]|jgi:hypothetical protein|nr:hypothetical protein [Treponema sp.]
MRNPCGTIWNYPGEIPSHDTIQWVWAMPAPEFRNRWNEIIAGSVGDTVRKIPALDSETRRGKGNDRRKADPIISAVDTGGFCLGEALVDDKSNAIHTFVVGHLPGPAH